MKKLTCFLLILLMCMNLSCGFAESMEWICKYCKTENNGNFCGECGSARPLWKCAGCSGNSVTKYCTNCGMPYEHSQGLEFFSKGEYEKAINLFLAKGYGDYDDKITESYILWGEAEMKRADYNSAMEKFENALIMCDQFFDHGTTKYELYKNRVLCNMLPIYERIAKEAAKQHDLEKEVYYTKQYVSVLDQLPIGYEEDYFRCATRMHEAEIYHLAMEWYEKSGSKATEEIKAEVKKKYDEQQKLLNTFSFEKIIGVADKDNTTWLYTQPARKALYSGDYQEEGQVAYLSLNVKNKSTTEKKPLKVSLKIDDSDAKYYTFNKTELKPEEECKYYISEPMKTAVYNCKWYVNDILVDYGQYTIADGTSSQYDLIKKQLKATPFIERTTDTSDNNSAALTQSIRITENCIDLATLKENETLIPKIELENTSSTNLEKEIALIINDGEEYAWWDQQTLAMKTSKVFRYTTFDYKTGKYKFTWYINGIKIADQFFELIDSSAAGADAVE